MSDLETLADTNSTGNDSSDGVRRICRVASTPSILGIMMSAMIKSGRAARAWVNSSSPSVTSTTANPSDSSRSTITARLAGTSSATSTWRREPS